jgi:signal transduction histidine kinase
MTVVRPVTGSVRRSGDADRLRLGRRLSDLLPRPLGPVRSIKVKLAIVIAVSGAVGGLVFWRLTGWLPVISVSAVFVVATATSQLLGHGMTRPLREMTVAARAMARGDYARRVRASSHDEVGELGHAFNLMAADLEVADRHRRELIANVSHELRTPITALQALLENIVDGVAEPDPDSLAAALAQTTRLGALVGELLDLSRLDAGATRLRPGRIEVSTFLAEAVRQATLADRTPRITPRRAPGPADGAGRSPPVAPGGGESAGQRAAAQSAGRGGVGDRPWIGRRAGTHGADQGPGIPAAERDAVFQRFSRGVSVDGGTGLGLAIVRWAVELHDGTIEIAQEPTTGCRIVVTLPSTHPQVDDHPIPSSDG